MKIVHVNTTDMAGGAAKVAYGLHKGYPISVMPLRCLSAPKHQTFQAFMRL